MKKLFLSESLWEKDSGRKSIYRIMKLTTSFILLCSCFAFAGHVNSQNAKVSLNKRNVQLEELLNEIEHQTNYLFVSNRNIDLTQKVSIRANNKSVKEVLETILENTGLTFTVEGINIVLSEKSELGAGQQRSRKVSGTVVDQDGLPVIGANIVEKGTTNGTVTAIDGKFSIEVPGNAVLAVSFIGYVDQEVKVQNKSVLAIILHEDTQALDEVVVTALGIKREQKALGYAVQEVKNDQLTVAKGSNVITSLTGKIAGLNIKNSSFASY